MPRLPKVSDDFFGFSLGAHREEDTSSSDRQSDGNNFFKSEVQRGLTRGRRQSPYRCLANIYCAAWLLANDFNYQALRSCRVSVDEQSAI